MSSGEGGVSDRGEGQSLDAGEAAGKVRKARVGKLTPLRFHVTVDPHVSPELHAVLRKLSGRVRSSRLQNMATRGFTLDLAHLLTVTPKPDAEGDTDGGVAGERSAAASKPEAVSSLRTVSPDEVAPEPIKPLTDEEFKERMQGVDLFG